MLPTLNIEFQPCHKNATSVRCNYGHNIPSRPKKNDKIMSKYKQKVRRTISACYFNKTKNTWKWGELSISVIFI